MKNKLLYIIFLLNFVFNKNEIILDVQFLRTGQFTVNSYFSESIPLWSVAIQNTTNDTQEIQIDLKFYVDAVGEEPVIKGRTKP